MPFMHLQRLLGNLYCCIKTYYKFLNEIIMSLLIVNSNTNSISLPINSLERRLREMEELINLDPSVEMSTWYTEASAPNPVRSGKPYFF